MAIEIVDLPMKNGWIFHSYVSLPEGILPSILGSIIIQERGAGEVLKYCWVNYKL